MSVLGIQKHRSAAVTGGARRMPPPPGSASVKNKSLKGGELIKG